MNILITQRHIKDQYNQWVDCLENNYIHFFEKFSVNIIPVSNCTTRITELIEHFNISGIILSGGGTVDSELYNGSNGNFQISKRRDSLEFDLINNAIAKNIPVLGICRGMQLINVFFKGILTQNISKQDTNGIHPIAKDHYVQLTDQLLIKTINKESVVVNSYHDQGILKSDIGLNLNPFAIVPELSLVEGFYHQQYPIAGIQWHPERQANTTILDATLMSAFLKRKLFWEMK